MIRNLSFITLLSVGISPNLMAQCAPSSATQTLDNNNVSFMVTSSSDLWWDFNKSQYEVPKGTGLTTTFSGGLWIAGKDASGQLKMAITRYRKLGVDFWPGPINDSGQAKNCVGFDRIWKVSQKEIDDFKSNQLLITQNIKEWPAKNNPNLSITKDMELAPFVDVDKNGNYNPSKGDYPKIKGDEALFWVFNDVGNVHTESNSSALGIEVHVMAYSYKTKNVVNNTSFYDYTIIHKGKQVLTDLHVGLFTDFDLGNPNDDFVGCDTTREMAYVYNGDAFDEDNKGILGYGANPPTGAIKITEPFKIASTRKKMSSFLMLDNTFSTSAISVSNFYNLLQGKTVNGQTYKDLKGVSTTYMYSGKPGTGEWSECTNGNTPSDRMTLLGFGPMTYNPSEKITFTYANIFARSINSNNSSCVDGIQELYDAADTVQKFVQKQGPTLSIDENKMANIQLFPNPINDVLNLSIEGSRITSVKIYDMNGQVIISLKGDSSSNTRIDMTETSSGFYILSLVTETGLTVQKRIVKR